MDDHAEPRPAPSGAGREPLPSEAACPPLPSPTLVEAGVAVAERVPTPDTANGSGVSTASDPPPFEFRSLHRFFGKLKAVNNISYRARPGEVVGFIGPNGAGKTTTMRILSTLDIPTAGDAFVMGYSVVDDPDMVRRVLGFMPDSFGRYPNVNVVEYLDFFARAYGLRGAKRRDALERVLVFTELNRIPDKPTETLSKGLAQRLGLARTLIHDPSVLILDEPAAGLDPRARVELRELIRLLATQLKKSILISSHILTELSEICDAAVIIEAGRILASGTVREIMSGLSRQHAESTTITCHVIKDPAGLERLLLEQPFVTAVSVAGNAVNFTYEGDDASRARLLKTLILAGVELTDFQTKTETLEDAFMAITRGVMQ